MPGAEVQPGVVTRPDAVLAQAAPITAPGTGETPGSTGRDRRRVDRLGSIGLIGALGRPALVASGDTGGDGPAELVLRERCAGAPNALNRIGAP